MSRNQPKYPFFEEILWRAVGVLGSLILQALFSTIRTREVGRENRERGREMGPGPLVHALWHNRLLGHCWHNRDEGVCVLSSQHRDSEYVVRVVQRLGFYSVRGSATRGGLRGMLAMLGAMREGHDLALTVDGPRGPVGEVKPGAIFAASRSGCPIVPSALAYSRQWRINSWDRLRIPKPFSRMVVVYGAPLRVPKDLSEAETDHWRRTVAEKIDEAAARADNLIRPIESAGNGSAACRWAEAFLTRDRDRWYHFPLLAVLVPLELIWLFLWAVREALYRRGFLTAGVPPAPAVCVGGLSVGGSGKTPVAMLLARMLHEKGFHVALLSRGYGRSRTDMPGPLLVGPGHEAGDLAELPHHVGDEAALVSRKLPGVMLAVDADRRRSADQAVRDMGAQVLVLDDGFGHRRFGRNLDLLVFSPRELRLTGHVLPAGYLREPLRAAWRARAFLMIRDVDDPAPKLPAHWRFDKPLVHLQRRVLGLVPLSCWPDNRDNLPPGEFLKGKHLLAVCGIARPEGFRDLLAGMGPAVLEVVVRPDHFSWPEDAQYQVAERARAGGATVVTTEKDAVKLNPDIFGDNCLVLCLGLEDCSGGLLDSLLEELLLPTRRGWARQQ